MQDEALNQKIEGIKALETEGVPEPEGMVLTFQVSGGTPAPPNILLDHFSLSDPTGNVSSFDYSVASMMDGMLILSRKKPAEPSVTLLSDVGGMVNYWIVQSSPGPPSSNRVLPDGTITVLVINPPCPGETVFRTRLRLLEAQGISSRDQKLARRDEFEFTVALPPRSHD
jgi:hypothetical protein